VVEFDKFVFSYRYKEFDMKIETNVLTAMEEILDYVGKIKSGELEQVRPGMALRFTEACQDGDRIWQGDLALTICGSKPNGYELAQNPIKQLVPGTTQGSKHCVDNLENVEIYLPKNWNEESLEGPWLMTKQETTILHPVHGPVTIPAGMGVNCTYQREWDREQQRERRARD
jgi:hypothetical protein